MLRTCRVTLTDMVYLRYGRKKFLSILHDSQCQGVLDKLRTDKFLIQVLPFSQGCHSLTWGLVHQECDAATGFIADSAHLHRGIKASVVQRESSAEVIVQFDVFALHLNPV